MKIMVIGHGSVGSVLCEMFSKEKSITSVICAEKKITHMRNKGKIHFKEIDISKKKQTDNLFKKEKPDIVINASLPIFNKILLNTALRNNVNYIDLASYWDFDRNPKAKSPYKVEQLAFHERFKRKKLIGLINTGASPGVTNLLTKECTDLIEKIDSIKIRLYEDTKTKDLYFPWSIEWLLDEINWKPLVYRNKKFKVMKNFSEEETFKFPEHIGERKVALVAQDEVGTIPLYIDVKNIDIKIFDSQASIAKFLLDLGLVSEEEIQAGECEVSPLEFISALMKVKQEEFGKMIVPDGAQFAFVIEAKGRHKGKTKIAGLYAIFPEQKKIKKLGLKANFISFPTAIAAKIFAMHIPKIKQYGVFPPEALGQEVRHSIISELKKHAKIKVFTRRK